MGVIRRSPCERYIKYLLVHPDGYSTDAVRDIIRGHGLDYPSDDYVERLRKKVRQFLPVPFRPTDTGHSRSRRFISKEQIYGFFIPDKSSLVAHKLLEQSRAKEVIEAMSLAGESPAFISHRVKMLGLRCTPEAIDRYFHYYWDLNLVDSTEVRALLKLRVEYLPFGRGGMEASRDQLLQYTVLKNASYKDPRRMLTEMPVTPVAGMLGQMRLGLMPGRVDLARIAEAGRAAAAGRVLEAMILGGPQDAARARDYATVATLMTELIEKIGSPDVALQKELQKLSIATEDGPIPHVAELPPGDTFTLDLQKHPEKEKANVTSRGEALKAGGVDGGAEGEG